MIKTKYIKKLISAILLIIFVAILIFPFYWQVVTSIKDPSEALGFFPKKIYWGYYSYVVNNTHFITYLRNSFIVSGATTLISIVTATFCAYAIARLNIKGKNFILAFVLSVSIFPGIALVSPLFVMFKKTSLLNTYWGLILPYITFTLPIAIWNLHAYFKDIPKELDEAAKIDGAAPFSIFLKIILPLIAPGLFATCIMVFITAWNEFLFGLIFSTKDAMRTLPVGIMMLQGEYQVPWGNISAASVMITVPVILIVLIFQKKIISGITSGSVKC